jgi:hypothetical protein
MHTSSFNARLLAASAAAALVLSFFLITAAPRAHAAALTEPQITAILGLLSSFGVEQGTIANVTAILRGSAGGSSSAGPASSAGAAPGASCEAPGLLSRGHSGEAVRRLQLALIASGVLSSDSATGYYGPLTDASVKKLQAQAGIAASGAAGWGVVGPKTLAFLKLCGGSAMPGSVSPSTSSDAASNSLSGGASDDFSAEFSNLDASLNAVQADNASMRQSVDSDDSEE